METVRALANTIEAKDRYTAGHSELVSLFAVELARKVGLTHGCPIEEAERLEQLRALDAGMTIRAVVRETKSHGIDTRADYDSFVARVKNVR